MLVVRTRESWWTDRNCIILAQNQGYVVAHSNTQPICDLLEIMKEPVLMTQGFRSSTTQAATG